jgi:hypothetical protein
MGPFRARTTYKKEKNMNPSLSNEDRDAACRALNEAEEHLASQVGIPDVLRAALLQAEANCRGNNGQMMPVAAIDNGRLLLRIPDDCQKESLFHRLWDALVDSHGQSVQFGFVGEDDTVRVIYMTMDEGYVASATISPGDAGIQVGDWRIEKMQRS